MEHCCTRERGKASLWNILRNVSIFRVDEENEGWLQLITLFSLDAKLDF